MKIQLTKNCKVCNEVIVKRPNSSLLDWENRVKYCSTKCRVESYCGRKLTNDVRKKMSESHMGNKSRLGQKLTEEHKLKISFSLSGENHWNWQGGITSTNHQIRNLRSAKLWREQVFERDNYTCQFCHKRGGSLEADHIKQFAYYPELRLELSNGRTLCKNCHKKTESHSRKVTL